MVKRGVTAQHALNVRGIRTSLGTNDTFRGTGFAIDLVSTTHPSKYTLSSDCVIKARLANVLRESPLFRRWGRRDTRPRQTMKTERWEGCRVSGGAVQSGEDLDRLLTSDVSTCSACCRVSELTSWSLHRVQWYVQSAPPLPIADGPTGRSTFHRTKATHSGLFEKWTS